MRTRTIIHDPCAARRGIARRSRRILLACASLCLLTIPDLFSQQFPFSETWRWRHFGPQHGLPPYAVTRILQSESDRLWAISGNELFWFDGYRWIESRVSGDSLLGRQVKVTHDIGSKLLVTINRTVYLGDENGFEEVLGDSVRSILSFGPNEWLVQTTNALILVDRWTREQVAHLPTDLFGESHSLLRTADKTVWVNGSNGLFRWDGGAWRLVLHSGSARLQIMSLVQDANGNGALSIASPFDYRGVWEWRNLGRPGRMPSDMGEDLAHLSVAPNGDIIGLHQSGLVTMRRGRVWSALEPLPSQFVNATVVFYASNGDLLVGSEGAIETYRAVRSPWMHRSYGLLDPRNRVNAILRSQTGELWYATGDGLIIVGRDGSVRTIRTVLGEPLESITGLAEDGNGNIWISSGSGIRGAFRWNGATWRRFGPRDGLLAASVHRIVIDRAGRPWFLGISERFGDESSEPGAYVLDDGTFQRWGMIDGLPSGRVYDFADDENGVYWFATFGGIARWNDGTWTVWTRRNGLKESSTFTIETDGEGGAYFGDRTTGLGHIRGDGSITYWNPGNGLIHPAVMDLQRDGDGSLWISTYGGLSVLKEGGFVNFGVRSGLRNTRLWPLLVEEKAVHVGTTGGGLATLRLDVSDPNPSLVVPERPLIEGNDVHLRWRAFAYWARVPSDEISVRYRLTGGPWSGWTRAREAVLDGVPSGEYVVELQARGFFGEPGPTAQTDVFAVSVPFYQLPVFFIPVGGLTLSLLVLWVVSANRKRAQERALREARQRTETIITRSPVILFTSTDDGTIISAEGRGLEALGMSAEQIAGKNLASLAEGSADLTLALATVLKRNEFSAVVSVRGRIFDLYTSRFSEADGRQSILGVAVDITEVRKAEEERYQSEVRYQRLFERVNDAIYIIDTDGEEVLEANPSACALYGFPRDEFIGRSIRSLTADVERGKEAIMQIVRMGTMRDFESVHRTRDGRELTVVMNASTVDYRGRTAILVVARDITERRALQRQLIESQRIQSLGTLAGGIAHDFNNILSIIQGYASMLRQYKQDDPKQSSYIDAISTAAQRGAGIVQQILTFARKKEVVLAPIDLNSVVGEFQMLLKETFPKAIAVRFELEGKLPAIAGDRTQLHQALLNLCVNARDAMESIGTLLLRTSVESGRNVRQLLPQAADVPYVAVSVTDSGTGMTEATMERIFDPFFTTKEVGKGTGLGLAVVYGIVSGHAGHVHVRSALGKGTTVTLFFPSIPEKAQREATSERDREDASLRGAETVLLVEDEQLLRDLLQTVFREKGYSVLLARDGEEGIRMFEQHSGAIAAVVLDMGLPGIPGHEVYTRMSRIPSNAVFIACSGFFDPEFRETMEKGGVSAFVQKPYDSTHLIRTVRTAIDRRAA